MGWRHNRWALWLLPVVLAFLLSLCFRTALPGFIPAQALKNLCAAARLELARVTRQSLYLSRFAIIDAHPYYYETLIRLKNSVVTVCSGAAVCVGGALIQTVFRNPLASANTLGISTGVNLGNLLFLFLYTTQALSMMERRYLCCYACAAALLLLAVGAGRLAGRRSGGSSVMDVFLIGAIVSQFGGVLALYLQYRLLELDETLVQVYQELTLGIYVRTDGATLLLFAAGIVSGAAPALLLRYRMNAAAFPDQEALSLGVRPGALRTVGLVCGGILSLTALIHCGALGTMAMAVPQLARMGKGAEMRVVCLKSACWGGTLLLLCRCLCSMIYVAGMALPVNFAVSVLILPLFLFGMLRQSR